MIMKMKSRKTCTISAAVLTLLLSACHEQLLEPVSESVLTSNNAYNTAQAIDLGVLGVYNSVQAKVQKDYLLMEMPSDNMFAEYYATEPGLLEVESLTLSSENNIVNNFWKTSYNGIFRANSVLSSADNPMDYTGNQKDQYTGELKFLRALFYFDLVRIFGDVPLVLTPLLSGDAEQVGRTPQDEVYGQIIADLQEAAGKLPEEMPHGRASKAAAMALLGRVYMHLHDWENARTYLEQVVNDFGYGLVNDFGNLFSLATEVNSEAIYSVAFVEGINGHALSTTFAPLQGVYGIVPNGSRVGRPSWSLHKLYEEGDTRKWVAIEEWQLPANAEPGDDPIWYPYVNKYMVPHPVNSSGLDIPVMRLGDMVLLYAEALYKTGEPAQALQQLNKIRERAFGDSGHNYSIDDLSDEEAFMDIVLLERRLELAFENQRWFDLIRSGRLTSVLTEFEAEYNPGTGTAEIQVLNAQSYMQYFPIPYEQIQLAAPGVLTQNEGY